MSSAACKVYINWFVVNGFLCLLPLLVSVLIINGLNEGIISSFIAYCFTLIVTSVYIFDREGDLESTLKWLGVAYFAVLWGLYVYYPDLAAENQKQWIDNNRNILLLSILSSTLLLSFFMNRPSMKEVIEKKKSSSKFRKAKKTEKRVDRMMEKISKESKDG